MKIEVLLNIGTNDSGYLPLKQGIHEVDQANGDKLVKRGWAVDLTPPPPKIEAVPPPAEIQADEGQASNKTKSSK